MEKTLKNIIKRLDSLYKKYCCLKTLVEEIEASCCGGGGEAYPQVNTYADLPITVGTPVVGAIYVVLTSTGTWFWNRKEAGLWRKINDTGSLTDWERLGSWNDIAKDGNFTLVNSADITKTANFDLSGLTTATNRVLSFQDASGTIAYLSDFSPYLTSATAALTYEPLLGFTPYNATNPSNFIALTALSSSATGLTYTNTSGVFSLTSGYVIPTTTEQTDWNTAYTNRITSLTTTGSSGASTLITNTLNIPNYTLAGLGGQPLATNLTSLSGLSYVSASFVKMTAAGTFALDTNTYLTGNQSISLSSDVTGTGTTAITTTISAGAVTLAKMANLSANTIIGNNTGGSAVPLALTATQTTAMLDLFSTSATTKGLVPGSNSLGATYYLDGSGAWSVPPGGAGGSPGGSNTQVQYNNAGAFGGATNAAINGSGILDLNTSVLGSATFSAFNTVTTNLSIGGAATTFNLGGTPTSTLTANIFTNATASGSTKTINIGTAGASGSTTTMNFGSSSSTNNTFTFNNGDLSVYGIRVGRGLFKDLESTAVGYRSINSASAGTKNSAFGFYSLRNSSTGYNNTALGAYAMGVGVVTGYSNVALGANSLQAVTSGYDNLGIGSLALQANTTGYSNVGLGTGALYLNVSGTDNLAIGAYALRNNTDSFNVAIGSTTMYNNTTGTGNTAIGGLSMYNNSTGDYNVGVGQASLYSTTGDFNVGIGTYAGYDTTSSLQSVFIGYNTGRGITTGDYNTIIGANITGLSATLSNHILIADGAGTIRIKVDNNGHLELPGMQTGNAGLSSGQTYKDTAANILANGDWVIGMKA